MNTPKLTIAIPTFNRPEPLGRTLESLLPQMSPGVTLLILDNCSSRPVETAQASVLAGFPNSQVRVIRNSVNVGGSANVLRCFEHCSTEWLVILGDDDEIASDYVRSILEATQRLPSSVFINFRCNLHSRGKDYETTGLSEFCRQIEELGNVFTLSCGVYKTEAMLPFLRFGYTYSYTLVPHTAVLMECLRVSNGRAAFLSKQIVAIGVDPKTDTWSRWNQSKFVFLLELVPDRMDQEALLVRLRAFFPSAIRVARFVAERRAAQVGDAKFLYELLTFSLRTLRPRLRSRLIVPVMHFIVSRPTIASAFFGVWRKVFHTTPATRIPSNHHQGF